ncbi:LOW QUALITY PROTEIN: hypothetical protein PHMEG_00029342 [Phytophthora megakarya]|uniref:MULE transposase domain-containing protein n=1 Tax=Phytophthora megakarya TaxID=4795 RepID=A0A225V3V7_9STRA|nr:LOW QUALITY PROTEIN: hypothetical protein PHMEG_00029342 [Phytophthora megakarya]
MLCCMPPDTHLHDTTNPKSGRRTGVKNEYEFRDEHTCQRGRRATLPPGLDVTEDMTEATDTMALTRMDLTPERIWKQIRDDFYPESLPLVQYGLTREQVIQRVHRTRRSHFGADLHGVVEVPPLSLVPGSRQPFFQFYRSYMNGSTLERLVGWAHPALLKLVKYKRTTLFLDGTFRCVPQPFYQCVVMMVFDNATDLFVPVFYTLCTAKTQDTYWHLMEAVNVAADDKIEPFAFCDFEEGLQAAAQVQFPDADIVGCYFHFKQACRRKMKALQIPEREAAIAMRKGVLDMLTVIPHNKIEGPGIQYVQDKIRSICAEENVAFTEPLWELFWSYFRKSWLKTYKPSVWNVHDVDEAMVSRTNNPLERFNREINAALPSPHPSLPAFVAMIQALSQRHVDRIDDMAKCRAKKRPRRRNIEPVNLPESIFLE